MMMRADRPLRPDRMLMLPSSLVARLFEAWTTTNIPSVPDELRSHKIASKAQSAPTAFLPERNNHAPSKNTEAPPFVNQRSSGGHLSRKESFSRSAETNADITVPSFVPRLPRLPLPPYLETPTPGFLPERPLRRRPPP